MPYGQVEVRDGLRLDALRGIDHEQRPFARGDGTRYLVREIDVSRGVDQVERVALAVAGRVLHLYGVALDGDALFALEVHVVEHLRLHFALVQRVGLFQQAVREGRFTMVDMGYDAEVADIFHCKRVKIRANIRNIFEFPASGLSGTRFPKWLRAIASGRPVCRAHPVPARDLSFRFQKVIFAPSQG